MKNIFLLSMIFICGCEGAYPKRTNYVLHEIEKVAVPEFYRKIIGYDSLQVVHFMGKWEVNFCNPNQWEFEKFKLLNNSDINIGSHKGDIIIGDKNVYK